MKNKLRGSACLITAVLIWGSAFIAQSVGMEKIGPFTFQTFRNGLALLFLIPTVFLLDLGKCSVKQSFEKWKTPGLWKAGLLCGLALFCAASFQQVGLVYTDAGKAGFITAMYIVGVPLLGIFAKRKPSKGALFSVLLAVVGLYLLSAAGVSQINKGDLLLIGCALCYSFQILFVEFFGAEQDAIRLNCIQVLVTFLLSTVCMFATETFRMDDVYSALGALAYAGILSTGIAFTLQLVGQKDLDPTPAAIIMSMESVVAVICGAVILKETMTPWEISGCILMFAAVIISQLPEKK
ncbi:MAG: DMT family transporter [Oscillospiraceae bacterium]|nr:DMT family transporter [Oscillospiraceae bacterium]